jgi:hypothetical protein
MTYVTYHTYHVSERQLLGTPLTPFNAVWASEWHVGNVDLFQVEDNAIAFNAILSPRLGSRLCDLRYTLHVVTCHVIPSRIQTH